MAIKILCFGDSNTWGYIPGSLKPTTGEYERYDDSNRWPYILGSLLEGSGISCIITEDAFPGRTVDIDHPDNIELNGKVSLIKKHLIHLSDYKLVIIALGVNDLKSIYHRTGEEIAVSLTDLVKLIKITNPETEVVLVSPPKITKEDGFGTDFNGSAQKSDKLRKSLLSIEATGLCHLLKLKYELNPIDGVHFSPKDNACLANRLYTQIQLLLNYPHADARKEESIL